MLEVLRTDVECSESLMNLPTFSDCEKKAVKEIPIRCWKVIKAARCKIIRGVAVSSLTADMLNQNEAHTAVQLKEIWAREKAGTTPGWS